MFVIVTMAGMDHNYWICSRTNLKTFHDAYISYILLIFVIQIIFRKAFVIISTYEYLKINGKLTRLECNVTVLQYGSLMFFRFYVDNETCGK